MTVLSRYVYVSVFIIICVLCVGMPAKAVAPASKTPKACVFAIQKTFDTLNWADFIRLVDVKNLLDQSVTVFLDTLVRYKAEQKAIPEYLTLLTLAAEQPNMRLLVHQALVAEGERTLIQCITAGYFGKLTLKNLATQRILQAPFGWKELRVQDGTYTQSNAEKYMSFTLVDHATGFAYELDGVFVDNDVNMRLMGIKNLSTLIERVIEQYILS